MPSFDVVSKVDLAEVENAFNQAKKELGQRYDFRGTNTTVENTPEGLVIVTSDEEHLTAALHVLMEKLNKRGVPLKNLEAQESQPAAKQARRQLITLKQGIPTEKGKELVKIIKDSKLKVQAQIQDEQVRVTGKNRDDLQSVIAMLRKAEVGLELRFENFRD